MIYKQPYILHTNEKLSCSTETYCVCESAIDINVFINIMDDVLLLDFTEKKTICTRFIWHLVDFDLEKPKMYKTSKFALNHEPSEYLQLAFQPGSDLESGNLCLYFHTESQDSDLYTYHVTCNILEYGSIYSCYGLCATVRGPIKDSFIQSSGFYKFEILRDVAMSCPLKLCCYISRYLETSNIESDLLTKIIYVKDLGKMSRSNFLSNMKLQVEDQVFIVSKSLLISQSEYFKIKLSDSCVNQSNILDLSNDYQPELIEKMLYFIYSGTVDNLSEAIDLFKVANHYGVKKLKLLCLKYLYKNINVNNVAQTLILSNTYNLESLKDMAMEFSSLNFNAVMNNSEYRELFTSHINLIFEVFDYIVESEDLL